MTKELSIIKNAGYKTKRIRLANMVYKNPLNNRGTSKPLFMFNSHDEIFCINNIPYCPIGGNRAFAAMIEYGIDQPGYGFKEFTVETC